MTASMLTRERPGAPKFEIGCDDTAASWPPIQSAPDLTAIALSLSVRLNLTPHDHLLDLACRDGRLSAKLCGSVGALLGIDRSAQHIASAQEIASAQSHFGGANARFLVGSAPGFTATDPTPWRFTAAVWYGCFSIWPEGEILATLKALSVRYRRVKNVVLAAIPSEPHSVEVSSPVTQLAGFAAATGWQVDTTDQSLKASHPLELLLTRP